MVKKRDPFSIRNCIYRAYNESFLKYKYILSSFNAYCIFSPVDELYLVTRFDKFRSHNC